MRKQTIGNKYQVLIGVSLALLVNTSVLGYNKQEYIFTIGTKTPARIAYEAELIQSLLDVTEESWGAATLIIDNRKLSSLRSWKSVSQGKLSHLITTSNWPDIINNGHNLIKIDYPIEKGLLGYRKCLILKENVAFFDSIKTIEHFKNIVVGQGTGWRDIARYEENKIKVMKSVRFENLLPMLGAARFHCLPLGIIEIGDLIKQANRTSKNIIVYENMLIIYKHTVHIGVTPALPKLAQRLNEGMQIITSNGQFDQIFEKHFQSILNNINNGKNNVFYLKTKTEEEPSPSLINTNNIQILQPD